jgi:hypothetical protein
MASRILLRSLVLVGALLAETAQADDRPVVVELFTSQGCSSCPPAEALLLDLAEREDVLALAFHVDYWDRLGWLDPFSSPEATARQRAYAALLGESQVYTPQMVVDGRQAMVGSRRAEVIAAVDAAAADPGAVIPLDLGRVGDLLSVSIGAGQGAGRALLVGFDPRAETAIPRGENAGRTILQANVVRSVEVIAEWDGQAVAFDRPMPPGESAALILQAQDGRILGAALVEE